MDKKHTIPELLRAEIRPTPEQFPTHPPPRKRHLDSDDDGGGGGGGRDEPRTKRPVLKITRLTQKNLAIFNKMRKSTTSDYPSSSGSTKTLSTTSSGFDIQAYNNGILEPSRSNPPSNLKEIQERLANSRASASPPGSEYGEYLETVGGATNESTMARQAGGRLLKEYPPSKGYKKVFNQAFTGYPKNVGFNNGLSAPQPDFIEGIEMREYGPFPVIELVPGAVLYNDDRRSVTLPHIAGEWKGHGGDMTKATLQAGYDGAALVYARNNALSYMGKSDPPNHSEITTFTTDGTIVNFFAHYAAKSSDGRVQYHQYLVKSTSLVSSHGAHNEGRRDLRNAQDRAREQSNALKDQLKEYYAQHQQGTAHPVAGEAPSLNADGYEVGARQSVSQPMRSASSNNKSSTTNSRVSHRSNSTPRSWEASPSTHSSMHNSGQKQNTPSSQGLSSSSAHYSRSKSYWTKDARSGRLYHKHSDGTVS